MDAARLVADDDFLVALFGRLDVGLVEGEGGPGRTPTTSCSLAPFVSIQVTPLSPSIRVLDAPGTQNRVSISTTPELFLTLKLSVLLKTRHEAVLVAGRVAVEQPHRVWTQTL